MSTQPASVQHMKTTKPEAAEEFAHVTENMALIFDALLELEATLNAGDVTNALDLVAAIGGLAALASEDTWSRAPDDWRRRV